MIIYMETQWYERYSVHKIESRDLLPNGLNPKEYSLFKYWSDAMARKFGYRLAQTLIQECLSKRAIDKQIVIMPSAYQNVVPAAYSLAKYCGHGINLRLSQKWHRSVQHAKIERTLSYNEDFGQMNLEERQRALTQDAKYVDKVFIWKPNKVDPATKTLIVIDDILITWTHERLTKKLIVDDIGHEDVTFAYYAEVANKDVDPTIENELNHAYVKKLSHINTIIREWSKLNARTIKFILWYEDKRECASFLTYQHANFLHSLFNGAISNDYHLDARYQESFNILSELLKNWIDYLSPQIVPLYDNYKFEVDNIK